MHNEIMNPPQSHVELKNTTSRVRDAFRNLQKVNPEYYRTLFSSRSEIEGGIGSVYPMKAEKIESEVMSCLWHSYESKDIMEGCVGAVANIGGKLGIVNLDDLPSDATFVLVDPKKTGFCEILLEGGDNSCRRHVGHSVAILGTDDKSGLEIVFTFHPGDPIVPSRKTGLKAGETLTKDEAKKLGFVFAKVA